MNLASNWIYLLGFELAVVLLVVCLLLFAHSRGLGKLIGALEEKVLALRDSMRKKNLLFDTLKKEVESLRHQIKHGYSDALEEQLDATRNRHSSLSPDRDIVLDITPDTPVERQALALRHAFLIAEKEATLAVDGKGVDWEILQAKLGQIIQFYSTPDLPQGLDELDVDGGLDLDAPLEIDSASGDDNLEATVENLQRQLGNLEKFRKLYFDVEKKWREARAEAERYHQELLALGASLGGGEEFSQLLKSYGEVYGDLDGLLERGGEAPEVDVVAPAPSVGKMVIANQEEIQRLRNMALDQHKIITELKRKLVGAETEEDRERAIAEMQLQLDRSERYLKESDTCINQLESEISRLMAENESLNQRIKSGGGDASANPHLEEELEMARNLIASFTEQSRDMLTVIAALEEEKRHLPEPAGGDTSVEDSGRVAELTERLNKSQQELLNVQTQYIELEERFLELKMQVQ